MQHRTKMSHRGCALMRLAASLASVAVGVGCMAAEPGDERMIGAADEALWSTTNTPNCADCPPDYWPTRKIPVCFTPGGTLTSSTPAYTQRRARARVILEQEYEGIGGVELDFIGWNECDSPGPGTIRLTITDQGNGAGAQYGYQSARANGVTISLYSLGAAWDTVVLHEFAHALGFDHELRRPEGGMVYVSPSTGCTQGANGMNGDPTRPWQGDRFTVYDPDSILNGTYCHWRGALSELDKLGLEIVYPSGNHRSAAPALAFRIGDGTYVARVGSSVSTNWMSRGAHPAVFSGSSTPTWQVDGLTQAKGLNATVIPGFHSYEASYVPNVSSSDEIQYDTVDVDGNDSLHAALVLVAI